jgi:hypothetical protein
MEAARDVDHVDHREQRLVVAEAVQAEAFTHVGVDEHSGTRHAVYRRESGDGMHCAKCLI